MLTLADISQGKHGQEYFMHICSCETTIPCQGGKTTTVAGFDSKIIQWLQE